MSLTATPPTTQTAPTLTHRVTRDSVEEKKLLLLRQLRDVYRSDGTLLNHFKLAGVDEAHQRVGGQGVVQFAHTIYNPEQLYALKFFLDDHSFATEYGHLMNKALHHVLPPIHGLECNQDGAIQVLGRKLPPFVVLEKGESLDSWARRKNASPHLNFSNSINIILHLVQRVNELHRAGLAHRDLKPGNVILLPSRNEWTVIDFGSAAEIGSEAPMSISFAYAAPETVLAWLERRGRVVADPAVDVWALGVIAFELLTMTPNYSFGHRDVVVQIVQGRLALPWEDAARSDYDHNMSRLGFMRRTLLRMLCRDPAQRPSLREVLKEWNQVLQQAGSATTGLVVVAPTAPVHGPPASRPAGGDQPDAWTE